MDSSTLQPYHWSNTLVLTLSPTLRLALYSSKIPSTSPKISSRAPKRVTWIGFRLATRLLPWHPCWVRHLSPSWNLMTLDNRPRQNPQRRASHPSLVLCPSQCRNQSWRLYHQSLARRMTSRPKNGVTCGMRTSKRKNKRSRPKFCYFQFVWKGY